jgi:8-oxo-dGTP diphosphatase
MIRMGVGLVLINERGEVLLHQRKQHNSAGSWGGPGGELEEGEMFEAAVRRELAEECGDLEIAELRPLCTINYRTQHSGHWVGLGYTARLVAGEPAMTEPAKQGPWQWWPLDRLPEPLYGPTACYIESYFTGQLVFDVQGER